MKENFTNPNFVNSKEAFETAIKDGILSDNEADANFAGNFMYMWTKEGVNYFKNIVTRKYGYDRETIMEAAALEN